MKRPLVALRVLTLGLAFAAGCASSPDGRTDAGAGPSDAGTGDAGGHVCGASEVKLWGTVDGTSFDRTYTGGGFTLVADLRASFGTYGHIRLRRSSTLASEHPIPWGLIAMPREGPWPDERFCAGPESTLALTDGWPTFTLRGLLRDPNSYGTFDPLELPDSGVCEGVPVTGEISGCIGRLR